MKEFSIIISSFHQKEFTVNCVKSYLHFLPKDVSVEIIVIENSTDVSYKNDILSLNKDIIWVNNNTKYLGANANANAIEVGMKYVTNKYVFLSHNDTCVTSQDFYYSILDKVNSGYELVGTCYDVHPKRNFSIIVLGCMVRSDIVRAVDLYPLDRPDGTPYYECGDRINIYCKENNIKYHCFKNTHNNPEILDILQEPYKSLPFTLRTINDNNQVIFLHFARGTIKTMKKYAKAGRLTVSQVLDFCNKQVFGAIK